ncbi:hypothetical protein [Lysobacter sp. CA199]|uniref:hypothetical protein n=1 Tax=Lysobacter sp. CA199 TaxID=3455608 RepID=UPI003F8D010D
MTSTQRWLLGLEAFFFAAPACLLAIVGVVGFIPFGLKGLPDAEAAITLALGVGIAIMLFEFLRLIIRTLREQPYRFGAWFWVALAVAGFAAYLVLFTDGFAWPVAVALVAPAALVAAHFIVLQLLWRKRSAQVR